MNRLAAVDHRIALLSRRRIAKPNRSILSCQNQADAREMVDQ